MRFALSIGMCSVAIVFCASAMSEEDVDMPILNWVGRKESVRATKDVVMKILREDKSLSFCCEDDSTQRRRGAECAERCAKVAAGNDNVLVHGDNLEALKALLPFYAGQVKCIYIDPPYNTGNAFPDYNDSLEHSTWLQMMYPRIKLLRDFLSKDGHFFMQLDDNELDYAKVVCDEIFGRNNFVNRITIDVRAPSAFSTVNPGVFKCSEYILWYARDKKTTPMVKERVVRDVDFAYKFWLKNPDDNYEKWEWCLVSEAYAEKQAARKAKQKAKGKSDSEFNPEAEYKKYQKFIIENAYRILRTASISDSGAGEDMIDLKKKSIDEPDKIFFLRRDGYDDAYVKNGEQIIFYGKNIREIDGKKCATRQITNIWNDIPWEGIAKEGGVTLKKSKKPERLVRRILDMTTGTGDLVLDSFLGSGTTAAVAHKMGRRWIGIEMGEHAKTLCAPRLKSVCEGEQSGISKTVGWKGGGGFRFYELGEPLVDENGAIAESVEFDTLAAHIWWWETGCAWQQGGKSTVLGVHDGIAYALLYNGILHDRSVGGGNVLTSKTLRLIREDIGDVKADKTIVYAECTRLGADKLKSEGVEFRQTPYDILTRR